MQGNDYNVTLTPQCLQTTTNFTSTVYTNVCTGTRTEVPTGTADLAGMGLLVLGGLVVCGLFGTLAYKIAMD